MKYRNMMILTVLAGALLALAISGTAAPLFFEDFKDSGGNFATAYIGAYAEDDTVKNMAVTQNYTGDLMVINATNTHLFNQIFIDYPKTGSLTWDTTKNKYLQAWIPWTSYGVEFSLYMSLDNGATWTKGIYGDNFYGQRIDNWDGGNCLVPLLVDVNSLYAIPDGTHQVRFRFWTSYVNGTVAEELGVAIDWIKAGMSPAADVTINSSAAACGFVGPTDGTMTSNPPTLDWSAPAGLSGLNYIVSYSQDPHFRGATTVTVHGVTATSYTPAAPLADGLWYWTVIPVTSDDIAGRNMNNGLLDGAAWWDPWAVVYRSFEVHGLNNVTKWLIYE